MSVFNIRLSAFVSFRLPVSKFSRKQGRPSLPTLMFALAGSVVYSTDQAEAACTVPHTISNGQTADATEVMGNFNALKHCADSAVAPSGSPAAGNLSVFSSANTVTGGNLSGDVATSGGTVTTLSSTGVTPGSYTSANITVDAKGRITSAANGSSGGGGFEALISRTITSGNLPSVTFSAIPGTYRELKLRVFGKSTNPGNDHDTLLIQLNGDTGSNYNWARDGSTDSGGFVSGAMSQTAATVGYVTGATSTASFPGFAELQIPYYADTNWKKIGWAKSIGIGAGSIYQMNLGFSWNSSSAITQMLVKPSGSNTFVDGTIIDLVGVSY